MSREQTILGVTDEKKVAECVEALQSGAAVSIFDNDESRTVIGFVRGLQRSPREGFDITLTA